MLPLSAFLYLEVFAAAALAAWVFVRCRSVGPKSLPMAFAAMLAAMGVMSVFPSLVPLLLSSAAGTFALLCLALLPPVALFLTTAWVIRAILAQAGSPSDGERVRGPRVDASGPTR